MKHSIVIVTCNITSCCIPYTDSSDQADDSEKGAEPDFAELACDVVSKIPNMWKPLARKLGFGYKIPEIEENNPEGNSHCFAKLFVLWKEHDRRGGRPKFTWASLITALESINEVALAEELRQEYTGEYILTMTKMHCIPHSSD